MKLGRIALLFVSTVCLMLSASADEVAIPVDKLPKAVVEAVKGKFPKAEFVKAEQEDDIFEIVIKSEGREFELGVSKEGKIVEIEHNLKTEELRIENVYNVEVEEDHTYFVSGEGWEFDVWSHNLLCEALAKVITRTGMSWSTSRKEIWQTLAKMAHADETIKKYFSSKNLDRMAKGLAPLIRVEMRNRKDGRKEIVDMALELHHKFLPQRGGSGLSHQGWNL